MSANRDKDIVLKELFDQHFGPLVLFANKILNSRPAAEDLVQDVFLVLWEKNRLNTINTSFLFRCVKNASLNYLKTSEAQIYKVSDTILFSVSSDDSDIEDEIIRMKQLEKLQLAIEQLPQQCRTVLNHVYFNNQKYADVASTLNISLNTVRSHMYMAFKTIKEHLVIILLILLFFRP